MEQLLRPSRHPSVTHRPTRRVAASSNLSTLAHVARVAGVDADNRILVEVAGLAGPRRARLLRGIRRADLLEDGGSREVLVVFDGGRVEQPVIVGLLQEELDVAGAGPAARVTVAGTPETESGKERVLIEALAELVLKCGSGSITLRKDGKIVLRGTHLLSRSSGPIRIKGGHVEIN